MCSFSASCSACSAALHREPARSCEGLFLQVGGWKKIAHVPNRCHNARCSRKYRPVWYNFIQIGTSRHWHCYDDKPHHGFFLRLAPAIPSNMSVSCPRPKCTLGQRVCGVAHFVPTRSDEHMTKVWIMRRVLVRAHARAVQSSANPVESIVSIDLALPAPEILRGIAPWYHRAMEVQRARQFHAGEKDATLLVMDGKQKLRRRVCAYPCCEHLHSKSLGLGVWRCCSETPAQRPGKRARSQKAWRRRR